MKQKIILCLLGLSCALPIKAGQKETVTAYSNQNGKKSDFIYVITSNDRTRIVISGAVAGNRADYYSGTSLEKKTKLDNNKLEFYISDVDYGDTPPNKIDSSAGIDHGDFGSAGLDRTYYATIENDVIKLDCTRTKPAKESPCKDKKIVEFKRLK